jgi:hypothetical protein
MKQFIRQARIPLLVFFIITPIVFYIQIKNDRAADKFGLDDLNLRLTGVVDSIDRTQAGNYSGYRTVRIKIISSNIKTYDARRVSPCYFCMIRNGIAEIYDQSASDGTGYNGGYDIGDTIKINSRQRMIWWKNKKDQIDSSVLSVYNGEELYIYAEKYHQKF